MKLSSYPLEHEETRMNEQKDLQARAIRLFPDNEEHQKRWLEAVKYLRARGKWVADPGTPVPSWGKGVERMAA